MKISNYLYKYRKAVTDKNASSVHSYFTLNDKWFLFSADEAWAEITLCLLRTHAVSMVWEVRTSRLRINRIH